MNSLCNDLLINILDQLPTADIESLFVANKMTKNVVKRYIQETTRQIVVKLNYVSYLQAEYHPGVYYSVAISTEFYNRIMELSEDEMSSALNGINELVIGRTGTKIVKAPEVSDCVEILKHRPSSRITLRSVRDYAREVDRSFSSSKNLPFAIESLYVKDLGRFSRFTARYVSAKLLKNLTVEEAKVHSTDVKPFVNLRTLSISSALHENINIVSSREDEFVAAPGGCLIAFYDFDELCSLKHLEKLELNRVRILNFDSLSKFESLKELTIQNVKIIDKLDSVPCEKFLVKMIGLPYPFTLFENNRVDDDKFNRLVFEIKRTPSFRTSLVEISARFVWFDCLLNSAKNLRSVSIVNPQLSGATNAIVDLPIRKEQRVLKRVHFEFLTPGTDLFDDVINECMRILPASVDTLTINHRLMNSEDVRSRNLDGAIHLNLRKFEYSIDRFVYRTGMTSRQRLMEYWNNQTIKSPTFSLKEWQIKELRMNVNEIKDIENLERYTNLEKLTLEIGKIKANDLYGIPDYVRIPEHVTDITIICKIALVDRAEDLMKILKMISNAKTVINLTLKMNNRSIESLKMANFYDIGPIISRFEGLRKLSLDLPTWTFVDSSDVIGTMKNLKEVDISNTPLVWSFSERTTLSKLFINRETICANILYSNSFRNLRNSQSVEYPFYLLTHVKTVQITPRDGCQSVNIGMNPFLFDKKFNFRTQFSVTSFPLPIDNSPINKMIIYIE